MRFVFVVVGLSVGETNSQCQESRRIVCSDPRRFTIELVEFVVETSSYSYLV